MKNLLRFGLICPLTLALLNGCGGGSLDTEGSVRLVNATSEYTTLDLYAASDRVSTGVASYGVGGYASLEADSYTFNLKDGGSAATAASTSREVTKKDHFALVAYTSGGTLKTEYLPEDEDGPSSGTAKLRVFHTASADAGSVDVYVVSTACSALSTSSAAATASAVSGLQSGYTEVSAASGGTSYHVCVTASGNKNDLRLDIPALTLSNQQVATLILTRTPGGVLVNGLLLTQQGALTQALNTSARVRLAASTSPAGVISATLGGVLIGANTSPAVTASYALVPAGSATLQVNGATVALGGTTGSATAGGDFTLLVTGTPASPVARLIVDDNTISPSTVLTTKIRVVNGLNGSTASVTLSVDDQAVGTASFGEASSSTQVLPSAALARLEAIQGTAQVYLRDNTTLTAGKVYSLFMLGDAASPTGLLRVDH